MSAIMASDSPGRSSDYLDSDSVWVSSQVLIICHGNSIIPHVHEITHNIKFHISSNKTQDMHTTTQTWQVPQSSQSRTTSTFIHNVSLRSVGNSKFWMPSRTLLSPSSLRDIWQQNEHQKTNRTACKQYYPASAYTQDPTQTQNWSWNLPFQGKSAPSRFTRHIPPFKLTLDLWTQPCRPFESNEWTSSWQRWPTILSFAQRTNSDAFGTLPRGIPAGTHSSPWSGRTLAGQMPLYPSLGHGDQWVARTECGP